MNTHLNGTGLGALEVHKDGSVVLRQDGEEIHVTLEQALTMADVIRATALEMIRQRDEPLKINGALPTSSYLVGNDNNPLLQDAAPNGQCEFCNHALDYHTPRCTFQFCGCLQPDS